MLISLDNVYYRYINGATKEDIKEGIKDFLGNWSMKYENLKLVEFGPMVDYNDEGEEIIGIGYIVVGDPGEENELYSELMDLVSPFYDMIIDVMQVDEVAFAEKVSV